MDATVHIESCMQAYHDCNGVMCLTGLQLLECTNDGPLECNATNSALNAKISIANNNSITYQYVSTKKFLVCLHRWQAGLPFASFAMSFDNILDQSCTEHDTSTQMPHDDQKSFMKQPLSHACMRPGKLTE